jgi:hypothetical protein
MTDAKDVDIEASICVVERPVLVNQPGSSSGASSGDGIMITCVSHNPHNTSTDHGQSRRHSDLELLVRISDFDQDNTRDSQCDDNTMESREHSCVRETYPDDGDSNGSNDNLIETKNTMNKTSIFCTFIGPIVFVVVIVTFVIAFLYCKYIAQAISIIRPPIQPTHTTYLHLYIHNHTFCYTRTNVRVCICAKMYVCPCVL